MWVGVFMLLIALVVVVMVQQTGFVQNTPVPFSKLVQMVDEGQVATMTIKGSRIEALTTDNRKVNTVGPEKSDYYLEYFGKKGITPDFKEAGDASWVGNVAMVLVVLLTGAMFLLFIRQIQAGNGRAMSFGKSRAKMLTESGKRITFADVAGCDEAKEELEEVIQFLKDPRKFTRLGGRIPKGVLLMGAPGTGKTLLARAVAGEAGVPFFSISGSEFVEMFVGVGASRVRDLFEQAKKQAPCIVFIDEIDAVGRHRGAGLGGGHDEREQTLNQLLVEMDGFDSAEGVILVAATNRPDVLDPALLRPGRFDRRVVVPSPDVRGRIAILNVHARRVPLAEDVDLERIAKATVGFSGAQLENLVNEAALLAARINKKKVDQHDLETAKDKVVMGAERRSLVLTDQQKRRTAYHEVGHALAARLIPEAAAVNKISIVPRGMSLGQTMFSYNEEPVALSRKQIMAMMVWSMGGRAAEEIIFGDYDSGAANDIRQATAQARRMVCEFGMSDELGPVAWGDRDEEVFLGRDFARNTKDYSDETARRIDNEVRRLVDGAYQTSRGILAQNLHILHRVAEVLLEKETIDGTEFERLVSGLNPISPEAAGSAA
jgi:cell division protease FtsH